MCGIIGYIGSLPAAPILIESLKRLEYRGYDSAGIATIEPGGALLLYKSTGKVSQLELMIQNTTLRGTQGIGHTRWATHGEPTVANAHPHLSADGKLVLVHNGIIENYQLLKTELQKKGVIFQSDTDTEVLIKLIGQIREDENADTLTALRKALMRVTGTYAIALMDKEYGGHIFVARKGSPLVIGKNKDCCYFASDATALMAYTDSVLYPGESEIAVISRHASVRFLRLDGSAVSHAVCTFKQEETAVNKGLYPHYMLKEIFEQPQTLMQCLKERIDAKLKITQLSEIVDNQYHFLNCKRIIIVACGTSWHAGLVGKQFIEQYCRVPVTVEYASEFRYSQPVINASDVLIAVSQSGETADTLAAIELARSMGAFVYSICNNTGSSVERASDITSHLQIGPEIGVASTKAFTAQVLLFLLIALSLGTLKKQLSEKEHASIVSGIRELPIYIEQVLEQNESIKQLSRRFLFVRNFIYLGRGLLYPLALEGALKLKEISYIHAEGYPAAEMKHGPIALIDAEMPVVCLVTKNDLYQKVISNLQEVKARKGFILAIASAGDEIVPQLADEVIYIPAVHAALEPLLTAIPLQLLAYHIAVGKHCDVDQPRNLAKSVTVE